MAEIEIESVDMTGLDPAAVTRLPEVVVFEHDGFKGWQYRTNLNIYYVGDDMNDKISSIIVVSGIWDFFVHWHYEGASCRLGPGYYGSVQQICGPKGVPNDSISSFRVVSF